MKHLDKHTDKYGGFTSSYKTVAEQVDLRIIFCICHSREKERERVNFTPGWPLFVYSETCLRSLDFVNAAIRGMPASQVNICLITII